MENLKLQKKTNLTEKSMRGVLFRNKNKQDGDQKPDYVGNANINDEHYLISGWLHIDKEPKRISLSFTKIVPDVKSDEELFGLL